MENWHQLYNINNVKGLRSNNIVIPGLKNTMHAAHVSNGGGRRGKKVKKCCEIAGLAVQFVISAVLGDPTVLIAGVVGAFMSRS